MCFAEEYNFVPQACPVFENVPGSGKSKFFESIFRVAFGGAYTKYTKPELSKLGIKEAIVGLPVVILDEPKLTKADYLDFKSFVTEPTVHLRAMYKSAHPVRNISKFIILSNDSTKEFIKGLRDDERRFSLFRGRSDHVKPNDPTDTYFKELYKYFNDQHYGNPKYDKLELIYAYPFVKYISDEKNFAEAKAFKFGPFLTDYNIEMTRQSTDNDPIAMFVVNIWKDPTWSNALWFKPGDVPKSSVSSAFKAFCEKEPKFVAYAYDDAQLFSTRMLRSLIFDKETRPELDV